MDRDNELWAILLSTFFPQFLSLDRQCIIRPKANINVTGPEHGRGFDMRNRLLGMFVWLAIVTICSASGFAQTKKSDAPGKSARFKQDAGPVGRLDAGRSSGDRDAILDL